MQYYEWFMFTDDNGITYFPVPFAWDYGNGPTCLLPGVGTSCGVKWIYE